MFVKKVIADEFRKCKTFADGLTFLTSVLKEDAMLTVAPVLEWLKDETARMQTMSALVPQGELEYFLNSFQEMPENLVLEVAPAVSMPDLILGESLMGLQSMLLKVVHPHDFIEAKMKFNFQSLTSLTNELPMFVSKSRSNTLVKTSNYDVITSNIDHHGLVVNLLNKNDALLAPDKWDSLYALIGGDAKLVGDFCVLGNVFELYSHNRSTVFPYNLQEFPNSRFLNQNKAQASAIMASPAFMVQMVEKMNGIGTWEYSWTNSVHNAHILQPNLFGVNNEALTMNYNNGQNLTAYSCGDGSTWNDDAGSYTLLYYYSWNGRGYTPISVCLNKKNVYESANSNTLNIIDTYYF